MAIIALAVSLAACASSMPVAPSVPSDDADFAMPALVEPPGMNEDDVVEADLVRPGDIIAVRFLGEKDMEPVQTAVDRGGGLHLPLMGDVAVGGLTLTAAEMSVQTALRRYDHYTRVLLTLVDGKSRVATVTGAVEHPGNVPIVGDARLADVLGAVGGPKLVTTLDRIVQVGDIDGTRVMRKGVRLPVDARLALEGDPRHNVRIHTGDVIFVPPALDSRIVMLGLVAKPETIAYRKGMRLTEALAEAGGMAKGSDSHDIRILRGGYAHPKVFVASARDIIMARRPDVVLAPGDVVYVTEHWFATVGEVLDKIVPLAATVLVGIALAR
jgi:polysaccharide export outer membrane protein